MAIWARSVRGDVAGRRNSRRTTSPEGAQNTVAIRRERADRRTLRRIAVCGAGLLRTRAWGGRWLWCAIAHRSPLRPFWLRRRATGRAVAWKPSQATLDAIVDDLAVRLVAGTGSGFEMLGWEGNMPRIASGRSVIAVCRVPDFHEGACSLPDFRRSEAICSRNRDVPVEMSESSRRPRALARVRDRFQMRHRTGQKGREASRGVARLREVENAVDSRLRDPPSPVVEVARLRDFGVVRSAV